MKPPPFDRAAGIVQQRVFADRSIFRAELATVFDRAWLFVGPANWLAAPGEFVTSFMGDQAVIAWRDDRGQVQVFANRCFLSNESLTHQPRGRSQVLHCPCHGWAYAAEDLGGAVRALEPIARVAVHRGLVFAVRHPETPDFDEWLGEMGWYLDLFLPLDGVEAIGGDSLRWTIDANWKLPVLSACGDLLDQGEVGRGAAEGAQVSLAAGAVALRRTDQDGGSDPREGLAPLTAALFPNLMFDSACHSLEVVHPLGATRCEVHSYCLGRAGASADDRQAALRWFQFQSGPGGVKTGARADLWRAVTARARSSRHRDQGLSLRMGLGQERATNLPGSFAPLVSEANQRAFFDWWTRQRALPPREAPQFFRVP